MIDKPDVGEIEFVGSASSKAHIGFYCKPGTSKIVGITTTNLADKFHVRQADDFISHETICGSWIHGGSMLMIEKIAKEANYTLHKEGPRYLR